MSKTKKIVAAGKIWVSRHYVKRGIEHADEKQLEVQTFESEPARVTAAYGLTINTGNYNSARCDAGVELPCYPEEVPEAQAVAWELAEQAVEKQAVLVKEGK